MSDKSSALIFTHDVDGGSVTGYSLASVESTVAICAQGAAHGAWNETIKSVDGGSDETCASQSSTLVISLMLDMAKAGLGARGRFEPESREELRLRFAPSLKRQVDVALLS
jgi:hypothetical protein